MPDESRNLIALSDNPDNVFKRLALIERQVEELRRRSLSDVTSLSDITTNAGDIYVNGVSIYQTVDTANLRVTNSSGADATAGDLGYIDSAGTYKTTSTLASLVQWCAVLTGGADTQEIIVTTRGRVRLLLTGSSVTAGEYVTTSTTAGKGVKTSVVSPAICAVCLVTNGSTANTEGAEFLLLTQRRFVPAYGADFIHYNSAGSQTASKMWTGTILDVAPTSSPVTVATSVGDDISTITPNASTELAAIVIRNTTRSNEALLSTRSGNDLTFVSDTPLSTWQNGDSLTAVSADVGSDFMTLQLKDTATVAPLAVALHLDAFLADSVHVGSYIWIQVEGAAYSIYAGYGVIAPVAGVSGGSQAIIELYNRRFAVQPVTTGVNTVVYGIKLLGYVEAAP